VFSYPSQDAQHRLKALLQSQSLLTVADVTVLSLSGSAAVCLYQNDMNISRWKPVGHPVWYRPMKVRPDGQWGS